MSDNVKFKLQGVLSLINHTDLNWQHGNCLSFDQLFVKQVISLPFFAPCKLFSNCLKFPKFWGWMFKFNMFRKKGLKALENPWKINLSENPCEITHSYLQLLFWLIDNSDHYIIYMVNSAWKIHWNSHLAVNIGLIFYF